MSSMPCLKWLLPMRWPHMLLEENLRQVRTLSVGEVAVGDLRISYHGTQRTVADNEGGRFTADPISCACAAVGKFSMRSRCRPRYAPPWRQQDDTMRRRRSSTVS